MILKFDGLDYKQVQQLLEFLHSRESIVSEKELALETHGRLNFDSDRNNTWHELVVAKLLSPKMHDSRESFMVVLKLPTQVSEAQGLYSENYSWEHHPVPQRFMNKIAEICG